MGRAFRRFDVGVFAANNAAVVETAHQENRQRLERPAVGARGDAFAERDVGASTGHVRGHGHETDAPGLRDDRRLPLVLLRVEYLVIDVLLLEQAGGNSEVSIEVVPTSTGCPR